MARPARLHAFVELLLDNPLASSETELRAACDELSALQRDELERVASDTDATPILLAVAHARALTGMRFEQLLPDALVPVRIARKLRYSRAQHARVAMASARCVKAISSLAGESPSMQRVRKDTWAAAFGRSLGHGLALERLVRSHDVLVTGETGTGKEHVARAIAEGLPGDERGVRAPFAEINVAAVPDTLVESELFGHQKGAFTGATEARRGLVRSADKGCVFLDEVGDLPLHVQVKLLRVIETDKVQPLGSDQLHQVDVRFLAATHRELPELVRAQRFREDLYQRLAGVVIRIPPLRERPEDIAVIGERFVRSQLDGVSLAVDLPSILRWLSGAEARRYAWPGNVRQLRNVLRNLLLGLPSGLEPAAALPYQPDEIPARIREGQASLHEVESWYLARAMAKTDGNLAAAARLLGIDRTTVARKLGRIG